MIPADTHVNACTVAGNIHTGDIYIWWRAIEACRSPAGVLFYRHRRYKALLDQVAFNKALFGALRVAKEGYLYDPLNLIPPAVFRPEKSTELL